MISDKAIELHDYYIGVVNYAAPNGAFFRLTKSGTTENIPSNIGTCRETLHNYFNVKTEKLGFFRRAIDGGLDIEFINSFFDFIQKTLKVEEPIIFYKTSHESFIIIELNDFWKQDTTRQQLFSLFLRCTTFYTKGTEFTMDSLKQAMERYGLVRSNCCWPAIEWFLSGNVNPTYTNGMWINQAGSSGNGFISKFANARTEFLYKSLTGGDNSGYVPPYKNTTFSKDIFA